MTQRNSGLLKRANMLGFVHQQRRRRRDLGERVGQRPLQPDASARIGLRFPQRDGRFAIDEQIAASDEDHERSADRDLEPGIVHLLRNYGR